MRTDTVGSDTSCLNTIPYLTFALRQTCIESPHGLCRTLGSGTQRLQLIPLLLVLLLLYALLLFGILLSLPFGLVLLAFLVSHRVTPF